MSIQNNNQQDNNTIMQLPTQVQDYGLMSPTEESKTIIMSQIRGQSAHKQHNNVVNQYRKEVLTKSGGSASLNNSP